MDNKKQLIDLICKRYCKFYKESKDEDLSCEGFKFFERLSVPLSDGNSDINKLPAAFHHDSILFNILCERCDFLADGCDYRDKNYSGKASPCGGFILLNNLLDEIKNHAE